MKLLSFILLILFSTLSFSIEFYKCVDDKGQSHFTNLPKSSLDSNCGQKDRYAIMFKEDYSNLVNDLKKQEVNQIEEQEEPLLEEMNDDVGKLSVDTLTQPFKDILNPDKALDQLLEATEDRDDVYTRAMRGRSKGIENILR